MSATEQPGRATWEQVKTAPHAATAETDDIDAARLLIEELEDQGVAPSAIFLVDSAPSEGYADSAPGDAESRALGEVTRASIIGGAIGTVIGALLGLMALLFVPQLSWVWALVIGGVFGAGIGGVAGGVSSTKYSSMAWNEAYQGDESGTATVAVISSDQATVDSAVRIFRRHWPDSMLRFSSGVPTQA